MKTPDEIKQGLLCCSHSDMSCSECPYDGICNTDSGETPEDDAAVLIDHLLTIYSQVSKALCDKENADLEELLQAVSQVKNRLAQVERERDAAEHDLHLLADGEGACNVCARFDEGYIPTPPHCRYALDDDCFRWRGVCEENTKEESP